MSHFSFPRSLEIALHDHQAHRLEVMRGEKGWTARLSGEEPTTSHTGQGVTLENAFEDLAADLEPPTPNPSDESHESGAVQAPLSAHAMRKVEHLFGSESTVMTIRSHGASEFNVVLSESAHAPSKQALASSVREGLLALIGGDPAQSETE